MQRTMTQRSETSVVHAMAACLALGALGFAGCVSDSRAVFNRPEQATDSLVAALSAGDEDEIRRLLGPNAETLFSSGDEAADDRHRKAFLAAYKQRHELKYVSQDTARLMVGEKNWPMPIPLVKGATGWVFSREDGEQEIDARYIGEGELAAIELCLALVDAQREYAYRDPDGDGVQDYAEKLISDPGLRNGLYWVSKPGEAPSPLGLELVEAIAAGQSAEPSPYHRYQFRMLTAQGAHADGGERDYHVRGKLIAGFGIVAWPTTVGATGLSTFIVNQDGVVYQRYLGPQTAVLASTMAAFDPAPGWTTVSSEDIAAATLGDDPEAGSTAVASGRDGVKAP